MRLRWEGGLCGCTVQCHSLPFPGNSPWKCCPHTGHLTSVPQHLIGFTLHPVLSLNLTQVVLEWLNPEFVTEPSALLCSSEIHPQKRPSHRGLLACLQEARQGVHRGAQPRSARTQTHACSPSHGYSSFIGTHSDTAEYIWVLESRPHASIIPTLPHRSHGHRSICKWPRCPAHTPIHTCHSHGTAGFPWEGLAPQNVQGQEGRRK